jgi:hypothetical protein
MWWGLGHMILVTLTMNQQHSATIYSLVRRSRLRQRPRLPLHIYLPDGMPRTALFEAQAPGARRDGHTLLSLGVWAD